MTWIAAISATISVRPKLIPAAKCSSMVFTMYVELARTIETEEQRKEALQQIKDALMQHRNLCEDFIEHKNIVQEKDRCLCRAGTGKWNGCGEALLQK